MAFNENTRVKIPAILHLCRLGYSFISLKDAKIDGNTNIFTDIFNDTILKINPNLTPDELKHLYQDLSLSLENEDLGQSFYEMLTSTTGNKLIDFNDFNNNSLHVVTELTYKNGEEEFRPDITLLINGMPLVFIEVKKPNNHEGILAERNRINVRFKNKKLRKFVNISQILLFSNNMEYNESTEILQGAFYSTTSYDNVSLNYFREEEKLNLSTILSKENEEVENFVLSETNLSSIKFSPEFITNKSPESPTNRLLTSLFSKDRLKMLLKYSIAYVHSEKGIEKHIMRYPQLFATKQIEKKIEKGEKKGIIWHTQGSGKTALAYYNVHFLTDYFSKNKVVPKFYFIVDRLDLLDQAKREFSSRGLMVHTVNSKDELLDNFHNAKATHTLSGKREITVVNIQKFEAEAEILHSSDYDINIQRIYFIDEVHRSYDIKGSFLANLYNSDRSAILIGLTGTPLILKGKYSKDIFGDYIHKYYYNASIADGYTLKLIREGIETNYKMQMEEALKEIEVTRGGIEKRKVYSHPKFVEPLLDYIINDFVSSRERFRDDSIGGMVVCDSSEQARMLYEIFINKYNPNQSVPEPVEKCRIEKEVSPEYLKFRKEYRKDLIISLILHDVETKLYRKNEIEDFKAGKIDLLFVYNMLLTGFDAKRLKKLYIGRLIKDHNLLQTLTRVNRPYKDFKYGYVVDFADIRKEFDATNKAYFDELQEELGNELKTYSNLFKSKEEIEKEIAEIKEILFQYDLENAENFSKQISAIEDRKTVLDLKKALENAKDLFNVIRYFGHRELLEKFDFQKIRILFNEAQRHLELLNLKYSLENSTDTTNLINTAVENIIFMFRKVSESELIIADQLKEMFRKTREAFAGNFDPKDPIYMSLFEELQRVFKKQKMEEIGQESMKANIKSLGNLYNQVLELNRKNSLLKEKYHNDEKFARLHKRILENGGITKKESLIHEVLMSLKNEIDDKVLNNSRLLENEGYFESLVTKMIIESFMRTKVDLEADAVKYINNTLIKEYIDERQGVSQ